MQICPFCRHLLGYHWELDLYFCLTDDKVLTKKEVDHGNHEWARTQQVPASLGRSLAQVQAQYRPQHIVSQASVA